MIYVTWLHDQSYRCLLHQLLTKVLFTSAADIYKVIVVFKSCHTPLLHVRAKSVRLEVHCRLKRKL